MSASLKLFINQSANDTGDALVDSFTSTSSASQITINEGDRAREVEIHALFENPAGRQPGQPFVYDDPSGWDGVYIGAGTIDAPVTSGTFALTDVASGQVTGPILYTSTGTTVQTAIRAAWTANFASAVVTGNAGGPWILNRGATGSFPSDLSADTSGISPKGSAVEITNTQEGTTLLQETWELTLSAAPAILRTSGWTPLPAAAVSIDTTVEGSGTASEEQRITWNPDAYGGSVTLSLALPHTATITSSSVGNPSIITTAEAHGLQSGNSVTISGHSGSTPSINSTYTVTRISETKFSIPVNVTVAGTGGTLTATLTRTVGPLRHDVDEKTFVETLAAHPASTATEDSFRVVRNGDGDYSVAFVGALANLAIAEMTATHTLKVPVGLKGTIDCLTSGVRRLLNGSRTPVTTNLEIKKIVDGEPRMIAFRSDLRIRPELISSTPGSSDPAQRYLTPELGDLRYMQPVWTTDTTDSVLHEVTTTSNAFSGDYLRYKNYNNEVVFAVDSLGALRFGALAIVPTLDALGADAGVWPKTRGGTGRSAVHFVSLRRTTSQGLIAGQFNRIEFAVGNVEHDTGGYFTDGTDRLTPAAGRVLIQAIANVGGFESTGQLLIAIYKNGTEWRRLDEQRPMGSNFLSGSAQDVANGTDYYQLYVYSSDDYTEAVSAVFQLSDQV